MSFGKPLASIASVVPESDDEQAGSANFGPRASVLASARLSLTEKNSNRMSECTTSPSTADKAKQSDSSFYVASDIFTLSGVDLRSSGWAIFRFLPVFRFNSSLIRMWDIVLFIITIWTLSWIPFICSFEGRGIWMPEASSFHVLDRCLDMIFCLVPVMRMRTTVCDVVGGREWLGPSTTIFIMCMKDITLHLDLLSIVPILVDIFEGVRWNKASTSRSLPLLKLCRVHRVICIPKSHIEAEFSIYVLLTRIFVWVFIISHFMGCSWFALVTANDTLHHHLDFNYMSTDDCIPSSRDTSLKPDIYQSYHYEDYRGVAPACLAAIEKIELNTLYLLSLREGVYAFLGRVRPAFCDAEMAFLGLLGPIGGLLLAVASAQSTVLLQRIDAVARKHHEHMTFIRGAMKSLRLPPELTVRIESYHHFLAIHHDLNSYSSIFQGLSMQLFTDLKAHIYNALFRTAPFFRNACKEFINCIVLALEEITCSPGDNVVTQGEIGHEMYWILRGRCEVVESLRVVAMLSENQFFGEIALLVQRPRLCTVRASTYCLLAMITRDRFMPIINDFPEQKKLMVERIQKYSMNSSPTEGGDTDNEGEVDTVRFDEEDDESSDKNSTITDDNISRCAELPNTSGASNTQNEPFRNRSMSLGNLNQPRPVSISMGGSAVIGPPRKMKTLGASECRNALRRISCNSYQSVDTDRLRAKREPGRQDHAPITRRPTQLDMTLENEVKRLENEAVENRAMVVQFDDASPRSEAAGSVLSAVASFGLNFRRSTVTGGYPSFLPNKHRMSLITLQRNKTANGKARKSSTYSVASSSVTENRLYNSQVGSNKNTLLKDIKDQLDQLDDDTLELSTRMDSIEHTMVDGFAKIFEILNSRLPPLPGEKDGNIRTGSKNDSDANSRCTEEAGPT